MRTEESINEVVDAWRDVIKNKKRLVFSFDERVQIRLNAVKEQIYPQRLVLNDWWIRECYYRDIGEYDFIEADWRAISPGELWGGPDVSAFFKREIKIPERWKGEKVYLRFFAGGDSLLSIDGAALSGA